MKDILQIFEIKYGTTLAGTDTSSTQRWIILINTMAGQNSEKLIVVADIENTRRPERRKVLLSGVADFINKSKFAVVENIPIRGRGISQLWCFKLNELRIVSDRKDINFIHTWEFNSFQS